MRSKLAKMRSRLVFTIVALAVATGIVSASFAGLLGIAALLNFPVIVHDNQGTTSYDSTADLFSVDASPIAMLFESATPPRFINPTGSRASEVLTLRALIDDTGALIGGVPGDDLIVTGELDQDGDGSIDFAGVLLTAEVIGFGFQDTGTPTDQYDFRLALTGGLLAPFYQGGDLGLTVTSENSDFVSEFTVDFGGGAKGNLASIASLCALAVTKEGCVVPPPPSGNACSGKLEQLKLRYTGDGCGVLEHNQDPSKVSCVDDALFADPVRILVTDRDGTRIYANVPTVTLEGEVIAAAANAGEDNFKSETHVLIYTVVGDPDDPTDPNPAEPDILLEEIIFHTSCSQPLAPGNQFGSMFVQGMITSGGGEVIFEEPSDVCITEFLRQTGQRCDGKLVTLELRYTGGDCVQTSHGQDPSKVDCVGDAAANESVRILVTNKNGTRVWADVADVPLGGIVLAAAANAGKGKLDSETKVRIFDAAGEPLQDLRFHTSCSQPLELGNQFGAIQIVGMETTKGSSGSLGAEVKYTYTITNNGTSPLTNVTVVDDVLGELPESPIASIAAGETVELMLTALVTDTTTSIVTVTSNECPDATASATITVIDPPPPPEDCCENGNKLPSVTMAYTAENCDATNHSQDPRKVKCKEADPAPTLPAVARIRASDKKNPDDPRAKVWFDGEVAMNDLFVIDALNAGGRNRKLQKKTFVHVYDLSDNLLQTVEFHTSCSQPLVEGDQFGSLAFVGCEQEGGPVDGQFCVGHSKPKILTMRYSGSDCGVGTNSQSPDKVSCDGNPASETSVRIRASDKEDPNDPNAKVWHDGQVDLDTQFNIDAQMAGERKLKARTFVHIYDLSGNLLQTLEFHTSCSQPLNEGDQFGSLVLEGFIAE